MTPQATHQQPSSRKQRPPTSRVIDRLADALGGEKFVAIAALGVVAALGVGLLTGQLTAVASVTTMITLGMVLTLQHTSSRESRALNVKLDELIRVTSARNEFIGAEDESHTELNQRRQELLDEREAR